LIRTHQPLSNGLQNALLDINSKLAVSARACRATAANLHESRHLLRTVLDTIPARVFWKDRELRYLGCNTAFAGDKGLASAAVLVGRDDRSLPRTPHSDAYRADDLRVIETGEPLRNQEELQTRLDGSERWLRTSKIPLRDEEGGVFGILGVYEDITEEKRAEERIRAQLRERDALLEEVHHRVFNTLSVISGLLSAQAARDAREENRGNTPGTALRETRMRIDTMAIVYRGLYRAGEYVDLNMTAHFRDTASHLGHVYPASQGVTISIAESSVRLPLEKAMPCALIANELLSNALRHAFPGGRTGTVALSLQRESYAGGARMVLSVADDGIPLPDEADFESEETLGFQLVRVLSQQLKGTFTLTTEGNTKVFRVLFPE
ncbi:MAG: PAS domain S-box protein, partial [Spirochaetaceae bacterium]